MNSRENNITMIDDLLDVEDMENPKSQGLGMIPESETNKYQKFIRNNGYKVPQQAGMQFNNNIPHFANVHSAPQQMTHRQMMPQEMIHKQIMPQEMIHKQIMHKQMMPQEMMRLQMMNEKLPYNDPNGEFQNNFHPYIEQEEFNNNMKKNLYEGYEPCNQTSCLSVAEHAADCKVCSKLYNNDKTVYIIAIVLLSIICLLLLKKVLNI
jgi:hypothetical protein